MKAILLNLLLVLSFASGTPFTRAATTLRDIYGPVPEGDGLFRAAFGDYEGGAQGVKNSTTAIHSQPYAMRLKFRDGSPRSVIGIRFFDPSFHPEVIDLKAYQSSGYLEFWINPKLAPTPDLQVAFVSKGDVKIESAVRLADYLDHAEPPDQWSLISIPLSHFSEQGKVYGTKEDAPLDWSNIVGLNFLCDTSNSPYYDPSVDDIRICTSAESP
tara:strand:- start:747 stop:1388 length:642 start_codon:yes stop_codon:yes gene_type:complete